MCDPRKFGGFFTNKHNWHTPYKGFRICVACGRTERHTDYAWTWMPGLTRWLIAMKEAKKWRREEYPHDEKDALEWLNNSLHPKEES